jgi:hypothetical protein
MTEIRSLTVFLEMYLYIFFSLQTDLSNLELAVELLQWLTRYRIVRHLRDHRYY